MTDQEEEPELSAFEVWMEGAPDDHPLRHPGIYPEFLAVWNEILEPIERVQPLRIARKKDDFRKLRSLTQSMEQRAELLLASLLATADIKFEFAKDHPDLIFTDKNCGIEVGTRAVDGPRELHKEITKRVEGLANLQIILTFDARPLKLGAGRIIDVANEVVASAAKGPGNLRFDDFGLTVGIASAPFEGVHVSMTGQKLTSEMTDQMTEIEREIDNKIAEKRRQAQKMPTFLLLDVSRTGDSFMRLSDVWTHVLNEKLKGEPFVGLGVMISSLDVWMPRSLSLVLGDNAPEEMTEAFNLIKEFFHLKHTKL